MKRLLLVILLVLMAFAIPLGASARTRPLYYTVQLQDLNNSGVHGRVILIQRDNELRVIVVARGLEKNMVHMQHIHGFTAAMSIGGSGARIGPGLHIAGNSEKS